jgi:hypothetical protein
LRSRGTGINRLYRLVYGLIVIQHDWRKIIAIFYKTKSHFLIKEARCTMKIGKVHKFVDYGIGPTKYLHAPSGAA